MERFYSLQLHLAILFLFFGLSLVCTQTALERSKLEDKFRELHPNRKQTEWKEIENLKPDTLERVCNHVLGQLITDPKETVKDYKYIAVDEKHLERERVIKNGEVEFVHGLQYTIKMPIIKCLYEGTEFYLCHANETAVFRLFCDPLQRLTFRSGPHEVDWKVENRSPP